MIGFSCTTGAAHTYTSCVRNRPSGLVLRYRGRTAQGCAPLRRARGFETLDIRAVRGARYTGCIRATTTSAAAARTRARAAATERRRNAGPRSIRRRQLRRRRNRPPARTRCGSEQLRGPFHARAGAAPDRPVREGAASLSGARRRRSCKGRRRAGRDGTMPNCDGDATAADANPAAAAADDRRARRRAIDGQRVDDRRRRRGHRRGRVLVARGARCEQRRAVRRALQGLLGPVRTQHAAVHRLGPHRRRRPRARGHDGVSHQGCQGTFHRSHVLEGSW